MNNVTKVSNRVWIATILFLTSAFSACNSRGLPELGTVSGLVLLDGKPVSGAVVTFQPPVGRTSRGRSAEDGTYELRYIGGEKGALIGEHGVTISTQWMDEDPKTHLIKSYPETVPAKYNAKSDLTRTVEQGHNEINFDLSSK